MKIFDYDFNRLKVKANDMDEESVKREATEILNLIAKNNKGEEFFDIVSPCIDRYEYATKGETVRRGFYCTDLYSTFAVGGCNRGRLLKNIARSKNVTYGYGYVNDDLTIVYKYRDFKESTLYGIEYIEQRGDIEVGIDFKIGFDGEIEIAYTAYICQYENGKLQSTRELVPSLPGLDSEGNWVSLCKDEEEDDDDALDVDYYYQKSWYEYDGDLLTKIVNVDYTYFLRYLTKTELTFIHDQDGCPIKYMIDNNPEFVHNVSKVNQEYYRKVHLNL